jgi:hypothetical protein
MGMIMPDTSTTNELALNNKQLFTLAVERENKRASLMTTGDADKLAQILSDDLYYAHSSGTHEGKRDYIEKYRTGVIVYREFETEVEAVVPLGPEAVQVNGIVRLEVAIRGVIQRMESIYLVVWRRERETWRLLSHQTTGVPSSSLALLNPSLRKKLGVLSK